MEQTTEQIKQLITDFGENPTDRRIKGQVNNYFWQQMAEMVKEKVKGGKAKTISFEDDELLSVDLGVIREDLYDHDMISSEKIKDLASQKGLPDDYFYFSQWVSKHYGLIMKQDVKEKLEHQIAFQTNAINRCKNETSQLQKQRVTLFQREYRESLESKKMFSNGSYTRGMNEISKAVNMDDQYLACQRIKENIAGGAFLNPDEKRTYVIQQQNYENAFNNVDSIISEITDEGQANKIKKFGEIIRDNILKTIKDEKALVITKKELQDVIDEINRMNSVDVENKIEKIVIFNRELVKLSARRKRMEPISVFYGRQTLLDLKAVEQVMETAKEFDPKLFRNSRINIVGKPAMVLIPGYGNGVFDWKYNAMVIPTMPSGDPKASVFTAVVEYKLDCDEDRVLLASYNKLKDYAGIRSIFALKEKFIKDYIAFMTQETAGYKVLTKEVRQWFEHEVAPSKINIKIPPEIDPAMMSRKEFDEHKEKLEKKVADDQASSFEHFNLGVLYEYLMEDAKSMQSFIRAVIADKTNLHAMFNVGIMALKTKERKIAEKFFTQYQKLDPQSWWSGVCRDHLIKLR